MSPRELFALRRDIQMVFQDPTQSLNPRMTVGQLISEAWAIHPDILPRPQWKARVAELLGRSGSSPSMPTAIRTSSPAASGSASPSPARWRSSRS